MKENMKAVMILQYSHSQMICALLKNRFDIIFTEL